VTDTSHGLHMSESQNDSDTLLLVSFVLLFLQGSCVGLFDTIHFISVHYSQPSKIATRQKVKGVDCNRANLDYTNRHTSNKEIQNQTTALSIFRGEESRSYVSQRKGLQRSCACVFLV